MKPVALIILMISGLYLGCIEKEKTDIMEEKTYTYLALGDSYTIGEGVEEPGRYPNQAVEILKSKGLILENPTIIAKTGWTTDELDQGIEAAGIQGKTYDLVTLLIGVNNQYRGRAVSDYETEFRKMLTKAIRFAKGNANHVVVISIPDWGVTPFATDRGTDREKVAKEIDAYNMAKERISKELGVYYIDITEEYRKIGALPEMVVEDKLHPSALVYKSWAEKLANVILTGMTF
ncbi:SGNH/GDSL hydrolase family protein [Aquiflexum sp. LQ15W]|uniref:SGNH/GDSL hydrolase family protein n=1 Tax=Cognataquiflexum nitidum TaxID=2922272 RepID=UPI001F1300EC|nr:SGNH/GDSL hydrolase family protein [Cognataquiflexum nitidum]MCH6200897.1 SGNH/GDSL hydrolase family protein [Cognataquiflexum nitidum]